MNTLQLPSELSFQTLRTSLESIVVIENIKTENKQDGQTKIGNNSAAFYEKGFVKTCLIIKLNSLTQVDIREEDRKGIEILANGVNKELGDIRVSESDSGFMKQVFKKLGSDKFGNSDLEEMFYEGNCVSTTILFEATCQAMKLLRLGEIGCALTFEVFDGRPNAFIPIVHKQKNHAGQLMFANRINKLILQNNKTSKLGQLRSAEHSRVQDAYSTRCTPQVNGISYDITKQTIDFLNNELNQLQLGQIPIGQQFYPSTHSNQRCVQLFDFLSMALHQTSSISFVRSQRILNHLINRIPQQINQKIQTHKHLFTLLECISSLFLQNKNLCYPISADTVIRNNYINDVQNSLSNMYKKFKTIWKNLYIILGAEILISITALKDIKAHYKQQMTPALESIYTHAWSKYQNIEQLSNEQILQKIQSYSKTMKGLTTEDIFNELQPVKEHDHHH